MVKKLVVSAVLTILSVLPVAGNNGLADTAKQATAILYSQDEQGGMNMHCTVTAFEKPTPTTFLFVSAAHCVGNDDVAHEKTANPSNIPFYITFDGVGQKVFYRAVPKMIGYQHKGDDFSVFEVTSSEPWATIPIGDERKEDEGNSVINIASPLGLGLQVFHGNISKLVLDRPIVEGDINWQGVMLLQMPGTNGGSSGSSVISESQNAIVGFLVGTIGSTTITAIPASRFTEFRKRVADGKYKWTIKDDEDK